MNGRDQEYRGALNQDHMVHCHLDECRAAGRETTIRTEHERPDKSGQWGLDVYEVEKVQRGSTRGAIERSNRCIGGPNFAIWTL
jgi:hypothetical protein